MNLMAAILTAHIACSWCNDGDFTANKLVGIENDGYVAATMINSLENRSYIVAYDRPFQSNFGIYLGAATGYQDSPMDFGGGLAPVIAPYAKLGYFRVLLFGDAIALTVQIPIGD